MPEENQPGKINRFEFFTLALSRGAAFFLGVVGGAAAFGARRKNTVWQIDPLKCVKCEACATECVLTPSAVKCVQSYPICGYCRYCFGYFPPDHFELTSAAENQVCPTAAIERVFIEDPYWEYNIDEESCIGCAKCVDLCEVFGNASFYLQVRHDICVNCNNCSIAMQCPSDAWSQVPANEPYMLKHEQEEVAHIELDLQSSPSVWQVGKTV